MFYKFPKDVFKNSMVWIRMFKRLPFSSCYTTTVVLSKGIWARSLLSSMNFQQDILVQGIPRGGNYLLSFQISTRQQHSGHAVELESLGGRGAGRREEARNKKRIPYSNLSVFFCIQIFSLAGNLLLQDGKKLLLHCIFLLICTLQNPQVFKDVKSSL